MYIPTPSRWFMYEAMGKGYVDYGMVRYINPDNTVDVVMYGYDNIASEILLRQVKVASGYTPKIGDLVVIEWHNNAPVATKSILLTTTDINGYMPQIISSSQIAGGVVNDFHVSTLSADKITTGVLNTKLVTIMNALSGNRLVIDADGLRVYDNTNTLKVNLDSKWGDIYLSGTIEASQGKIGGFNITSNTLEHIEGKLVLDSNTASIQLSAWNNYATILRPEGIFGKLPIARVSNYPNPGSNSWYVKSVNITGKTEGVDYIFNKVTGEIALPKTSTIPINTPVSVSYTVYRNGVETSYTESLTFTVKERASALISDDSMLDASFVKNLIVGSAEIAKAAITDAHIVSLKANKVQVSDEAVLSSADGSTKIVSSGIKVLDNNQKLRVHLGQYEVGKFGLKLVDKSGTVTIIDEDGILQTWQEGRADNVDSTHPLILNVYIPPETKQIRRALLRFRLQQFRAYETGAASGGGSTQTSTSVGTSVQTTSSIATSTTTTSSGGQTTQTSTTSRLWDLYAINVIDAVSFQGKHSHGGSTGAAGNHNHGLPDGAKLALAGGGSVTFVASGSHSHSISTEYGHSHHLTADHRHDVTIPNHSHTVTIPGHSHTVTIPGHGHSVTIPSHTHALVFGIYTSTSATNVTVKINGIDRTTALGGPFTVDQGNLNITPYLVIGQWNTIELGSSRLGRIDATVFIQTLMGV